MRVETHCLDQPDSVDTCSGWWGAGKPFLWMTSCSKRKYSTIQYPSFFENKWSSQISPKIVPLPAVDYPVITTDVYDLLPMCMA